jgi:ankyrin repeat protein
MQQAFAAYQKKHPRAVLVDASKLAEKYYSFHIIDPDFHGLTLQERYQGLQALVKVYGKQRGYLEVMTPAEQAVGPLLAAAACGDVAEVLALLAAGADINQPNQVDSTALEVAAMGTTAKHTKTVQALLAAGADVNAGQHMTPLMMACGSSSVATIEVLLKAGADVNRTTMHGTALHQAIEENRADHVALLLKFGARADLTDDEGESALDLARRTRRRKIVELLEAAAATRKPRR